jgi:hypothetical protein
VLERKMERLRGLFATFSWHLKLHFLAWEAAGKIPRDSPTSAETQKMGVEGDYSRAIILAGN